MKNRNPNKTKKKFTECLLFIYEGIGNFCRSSFLSLLVLGIILLLINGLDQSYTLLIGMLENDHFSFILCVCVVFVFALVISHYPIYTYYARDINNSKDKHYWYVHRLFKCYPIFTFKTKKTSVKEYSQNYLAKFLRYAQGLSVFWIWHYYIYKTFYPQFVFHLGSTAMAWLRSSLLSLCIVTFILLGYLVYRRTHLENRLKVNTSTSKDLRFIKNSRLVFILSLVINMACLFRMGFNMEFNSTTYYFLQLSTFFASILYIYLVTFRNYLKNSLELKNLPILHWLADQRMYLSLHFLFFCLLSAFFVYSNLAVHFHLVQANALPILFTSFFIIYYTIASFTKYVFVIKKLHRRPFGSKNPDSEYKNRVSWLFSRPKQHRPFVKRNITKITIAVLCFAYLFIEQFIWNPERQLHTIPQNAIHNESVNINTYFDELKNLDSLPIVLISSHGGALKANIWTLLVINELQKISNGKFLKQSVSLSGASGGMLGLSMYTVLSGQYNADTKKIQSKIEKLALENFASADVSFTIGFDFIRKIRILERLLGGKDRAYYAMRHYQNVLEEARSDIPGKLDNTSFKSFWTRVYAKAEKRYPILIVNTAKTNGKRGVFCSVNLPDSLKIFMNSDLLSELDSGHIPFYMAVSTTNRFPGFSPAAKIKGYGHYIDAGVIDNSGLLSNMDLYYNYIQRDTTLQKRTVLFVEIKNGNEDYIRHFLKTFKKGYLKKAEDHHFLVDEFEQDNLIADLKAQMDIDKIPQYLDDFLEQQSKIRSGSLLHIPIFLPRKIDIQSVENVLGGRLKSGIREELVVFLKKHNDSIIAYTEDMNTDYWDTYEPTLARHLSQSTLRYYENIIRSYPPLRRKLESVNKKLGNN